MQIRAATDADLEIVKAIHERAFGQSEEAELTANLLTDPSAAPRVSLLAFLDDKPVGHVLFTKVSISGAERPCAASILAPLAVVPNSQGRGVGGELVREGLRRLAESGTELVFVLGHPEYYPRFGFRPAGAHGLDAPYPIPPEHAEAWMVQDLGDHALGALKGRVVCADTMNKEEYWCE